jgi:xylose isomerase
MHPIGMKLGTDIQNTNNLIVTVTHKHDLQEFSCVNKEIYLFNRKVQKIMKIKDNVKVVYTDLNINDFTRHGMHLNASGKEKTVELIGQTINILKKKQDKSPIILKWVETQINSNHNEPNDKTSNQNATIITTVAATVAASITTSATTATATEVATSTGTVPKPIRKSNRIKMQHQYHRLIYYG